MVFSHFSNIIILCMSQRDVLSRQDGSTQWAAADLGSNERKQKFLRLMGAGKVRFVYFRLLSFQYLST